MLRGAIIPSGEGQLIMRFEPDSYQLGENISRTSSIALILLLLGSAAGMILTGRRKQL
jgi:cation transporter-like permease